MAGDGRRWQEMAGDGRRWQEMAGDGRRLQEMAGDIHNLNHFKITSWLACRLSEFFSELRQSDNNNK
jgi:hypothetical protein